MVTMIANTIYDEKYMTVPMRHDHLVTADRLRIMYSWKRVKWHSMLVEANNLPHIIFQGSKEEFITQHFWGYAKKKKYTSEYKVEHELWKSYPVTSYDINVHFASCYGSDFRFLDDIEPESVFLVEGSPIRVYRDSKMF
jgi:hypothetical protein